jgi:hypothetical protein
MKWLEHTLSEYGNMVDELAQSEKYNKSVNALICYHGIKNIFAMTMITEIGDINRFKHPNQLSSWMGFEVREYSSGGILFYQVSSAINLIVQISRLSDGSRKITETSEVRGFLPDGTYDVIPLFKMSRLIRKPDGKLEGSLITTGEVPSFMEEISDNKLPFSKSKFQSSKS